MGDEREVRCPLCRSFVIRLKADDAEVAAKCLNRRCRTRVVVKVVGGVLTVTSVNREQQAS